MNSDPAFLYLDFLTPYYSFLTHYCSSSFPFMYCIGSFHSLIESGPGLPCLFPHSSHFLTHIRFSSFLFVYKFTALIDRLRNRLTLSISSFLTTHSILTHSSLILPHILPHSIHAGTLNCLIINSSRLSSASPHSSS